VEGFESVYVLQGGLDAWLQARYPIVPIKTGAHPIRAPKAEEAPAALRLSASAPAAPGEPDVLPLPLHAHTFLAEEAVVERLRQEAPAFAQRFEVWDPCLVLKGMEDECVSAFHLP
jgi:hypothetical protein